MVYMVRRWFLVVLHPSFVAIGYGFAFLLLLSISFWVIENYQLVPAFSINNYHAILSKGRYAVALSNSVFIALKVGVLAVVLAFPLSYVLAYNVGRKLRVISLFALLLPFFSSYLVRMFSWQSWLAEKGIVFWILVRFGLHVENLGLLFHENAVVIGLLSVLVPVGAIFIYLNLTNIDRELVGAARNLGASRMQTFFRITLPLAAPGMVVAFLYCFLIAFGDFICASILGGNQIPYLSVAIRDQTKISDWPMAAALGSVMLLTSLLVVVAVFKFLGSRRNLLTSIGKKV